MLPWGHHHSPPCQLNSHHMKSRQFPNLKGYWTVSVFIRVLRLVWSTWGKGITELLGFLSFGGSVLSSWLRTFCLVARCGKRSLHRKWAAGSIFTSAFRSSCWPCGKLLIFFSIKFLLFLLFPLLNSFVIHWVFSTISCTWNTGRRAMCCFPYNADCPHSFSGACLGQCRVRGWQSQKL